MIELGLLVSKGLAEKGTGVGPKSVKTISQLITLFSALAHTGFVTLVYSILCDP